MNQLPEKDKAEYYHRCYKTVDGLWFVEAEKEHGFDDALNLDTKVWSVMPKIQARFLKKKLDKGAGLYDLLDCLSHKLQTMLLILTSFSNSKPYKCMNHIQGI